MALESSDFMNEMVKLYATIWETHVIPKSWGHSKLVTLWKGSAKGNADNPEAYRALQIGSSMCKLLVVVIIERIKKWYQLQDQQQGFRAGRGTTDAIYTIKRVHQITNNMKTPTYLLFIDLTAAFDCVKRPWLFTSILQRLSNDEDREIFKLLKSLYSCTTTALAENPDDVFDIEIGVRQGGPEAPLLFNLFIDYVMRVFLHSCSLTGIRFLNLKHRIPAEASQTKRETVGFHVFDWIGYADDLVLMFNNISDTQNALNLLDETFCRFKLEINTSKTKTMILNHDCANTEYPKN